MYRVIIADDEPYIRDRVTNHMPWSEIGFEVVGSAGNGSQALEMIRSTKPDALLTDILMPGLNGLQLIEKIREQETRTKVVVMSAYDDFKYAQHAIRLGVKGYLLKPLIREEFVELLQAVAGELRQEQTDPWTPPPTVQEHRSSREPSNPYVISAIRFIEEHYEQKLRLEDVAETLYMNPNYFSSLFKREKGLSFVDFVNELRIRKAMILLLQTDEKVYEVSMQVGYGNFSYFNKLFKKINGVTPQMYRERGRGNLGRAEGGQS